MNNIFKILFLIALVNCIAYSGNLPTIGNASPNQIMQSTGSNFILIPVSDADLTLSQNVTVTAFSSDPSILQVNNVVYDTANTFANINVLEKGVVGIVTITVNAMDIDGTTIKEFVVKVDNFYQKGARLKVYDIISWQHIIPSYRLKPAMDTIINQTALPQADSFYRSAHLTVKIIVPTFAIDTAFRANGFTNGISGYIVPSVSGTYSFRIYSKDSSVFYLSTLNGTDFYDASVIRRISCTDVECMAQIYTVDLQAGQYYAFKTYNWVSLIKDFTLSWTGPGINTFTTISPPNVYPDLDLIKPSAPTALSIVNKGVEFLTLRWKSSTDNDKVVKYNIYKDGAMIASINDSVFVITGLGNNTLYSFVVTSLDRVGNESFISNIISTTTYPTDNTLPLPPESITFLSISDMSAEISWSGATDIGSEIIGYNVYLNGNLYNTEIIKGTTTVLKVLTPNSLYNVSVQSSDGAYNLSAKSALYSFTTLKFNPLVISKGVKKLRANIFATRFARNPGFGLNYGWNNSEFYSPMPTMLKQYLSDFKPSVLRWGDLSANAANFSTYVGTGKSITIGKFMQLCIKHDAYAQFTCGVKDNTDWRTNSATFTRFMEYLGDRTGQTPGGASRISEGQIVPFLDSLKGVIIEFGQEVWGASAHDAEIGADYAAYGQWCRNMAAIIKSSPYYDSTKISLVYSGRNSQLYDSYGIYSKLFIGDHHEVNGLSLSGNLVYDEGDERTVPIVDTEIVYYKNNIQGLMQRLKGLADIKDFDIELTSRSRPFYFYEANSTKWNYYGRLGQAVTMCDYLFSAEKLGLAIPSISSLNGGEFGITDGNTKLPFFNLGELLNKNTKGNILKSNIETIEILKDGQGLSFSGEPVGVHVFNNGTSYAIALFSREFDSDYQVQLNLPDGQQYGNQAKKYIFSGSDFGARISTTTFSTVSISDSMIVTVPKYSVVLYVFEGPDLGLPLLPLGYTKYRKIESLKIVTLSASSNINSQYGSAEFTVSAIPEEIVNKNVIWKITIPENMDVAYSIDPGSVIKIFSTGFENSNGVITLKVMSEEDTTVFDKITVTISGQVLSLIDKVTNLSVNVFPNPSDGAFHLKSNIAGKLNIYHLIGVKVRSFDKKVMEANIEGLPSGIYILEFTAESRKWTKKVVVK